MVASTNKKMQDQTFNIHAPKLYKNWCKSHRNKWSTTTFPRSFLFPSTEENKMRANLGNNVETLLFHQSERNSHQSSKRTNGLLGQGFVSAAKLFDCAESIKFTLLVFNFNLIKLVEPVVMAMRFFPLLLLSFYSLHICTLKYIYFW